MKLIKSVISIMLLSLSSAALSENILVPNLTIKLIRAVGDYSGTTFDNTVELHFTVPLTYPAPSDCTTTHRVYVDSKHQHIISAAYAAFLAGKKVNVHVDSTLPIRHGACEVSFLDIIN